VRFDLKGVTNNASSTASTNIPTLTPRPIIDAGSVGGNVNAISIDGYDSTGNVHT
jgi:hypothetical protein